MIDRLLHLLGVIFWRAVFFVVVIFLMPIGIAGIGFIACVEWSERRSERKKAKTSDDYYGR